MTIPQGLLFLIVASTVAITFMAGRRLSSSEAVIAQKQLRRLAPYLFAIFVLGSICHCAAHLLSLRSVDLPLPVSFFYLVWGPAFLYFAYLTSRLANLKCPSCTQKFFENPGDAFKPDATCAHCSQPLAPLD